MLTQDEFNALVQLLQRAPMTRSEALWLAELLLRLRPPAAVGQSSEADASSKESTASLS